MDFQLPMSHSFSQRGFASCVQVDFEADSNAESTSKTKCEHSLPDEAQLSLRRIIDTLQGELKQKVPTTSTASYCYSYHMHQGKCLQAGNITFANLIRTHSNYHSS